MSQFQILKLHVFLLWSWFPTNQLTWLIILEIVVVGPFLEVINYLSFMQFYFPSSTDFCLVSWYDKFGPNSIVSCFQIEFSETTKVIIGCLEQTRGLISRLCITNFMQYPIVSFVYLWNQLISTTSDLDHVMQKNN